MKMPDPWFWYVLTFIFWEMLLDHGRLYSPHNGKFLKTSILMKDGGIITHHLSQVTETHFMYEHIRFISSKGPTQNKFILLN